MECPASAAPSFRSEGAPRSATDRHLAGSQSPAKPLLHRTMMLLCFRAYILYTRACRFTTSKSSLACLRKSLTACALASCGWALNSCFVFRFTYLSQHTKR